jgi:cystathionine beta-lyase
MVGYTPAEGTFLAWLDFSAVLEAINAKEMAAMHGLESPEHYFQDWLVEHSGVLLNPGSNYGSGGAGYMRMNIASARIVVKEALDAMAGALRQV